MNQFLTEEDKKFLEEILEKDKKVDIKMRPVDFVWDKYLVTPSTYQE